MAKIPKTKVYNPQKAEAYVGKKVLKNGDTLTAIKGAITPVPNGPLIKKDGTSLKKDGKITQADILKGRGVIAKKGAKVKPCMNCGGKMKSGGKAKKK